MTATIIQFPTLEERDALEFDRLGTSSYTRANGEAAALFSALLPSKDRASFAGRIEVFAGMVGRLVAGRGDIVDEFVELEGGLSAALRDLPHNLAGMLAAT